MKVTHRRRSREERIFRYQIRVYEAEIAALRQENDAILGKVGFARGYNSEDIANIPSIYKFIARPCIAALLKKYQEFLWTLKRFGFGAKREMAGGSARVVAAGPDIRGALPPTAGVAAPAPNLYVDITSASRGCVGGGIARVCRRIAAELDSFESVQPVALFAGGLRVLDKGSHPGADVVLSAHDTYLILDAFWEPFEEYVDSLKHARKVGARTVLCIHDVVPLIYPGLVDEGLPAWFEQRLRAVLPLVDLIVSVSRSSARQIRKALRQLQIKKPIVWFHLGHDAFEPNAPIPAVPSDSSLYRFVSIGTLEPKKGYDCALDAFDAIWDLGLPVRYTIVGKPGWACSALVNRIRRHAEFGKRLIWINDASDHDVQVALSQSYCFIQASVAEGFGLPIVEAAHFDLPVVASELEVFREIAGDNILYFPVCDSHALAQLIRQAIADRPPKANIAPFTWAQSAAALITAVTASHSAPPIATDAHG